MLDEGFHADEPKYRLAQLQDALLRDVRFIVGIKMHTQGMTVDEATKLFETQGHQPHPVAVSEAKRGTADALYGYYTMGKLMILKLRDDYKRKMGAAYSLQQFHDAFITARPPAAAAHSQGDAGRGGRAVLASARRVCDRRTAREQVGVWPIPAMRSGKRANGGRSEWSLSSIGGPPRV